MNVAKMRIFGYQNMVFARIGIWYMAKYGIARKRNEDYNDVLSHMRTRVRFSLLTSVLVAIRGERGKRGPSAKPLSSTSFNLITEASEYESF